ncbi:hypothetical protein D9M72_475190 [compost metagenome]
MYLLATVEKKVRWYVITERSLEGPRRYELQEVLDLDKVHAWGDKVSAKLAAQAMGLSTWRYVRLP